MFALVDCNNFYVSCERLFNPKLEGRPVIVLSNNDGCAVARSNEVKALGVSMGAPWFQLQALARQHGIVALSSNYALYGDMSNRVMTILRDFAPNIEVYSIDESFLAIDGLHGMWASPTVLGQAIRHRVRQWVGLPVCVGIAPTKTLAKLANHLAKQRPNYHGVCDLSAIPEPELQALLATIDVGEVWGVGRRIAAQLHALGIAHVQALRAASPTWLRSQFGVVMERTVAELQGISCIALEDVAPPKKQIVSSRSFGQMVVTLEELSEALTTYVSRAAEKLRLQGSVCRALQVFVMTNVFREQDPQYTNGIMVPLANPSNNTLELAGAALYGLKRIYKPGYWYKKTGVMLLDLSPQHQYQASLLSSIEDETRHSDALMAVLDRMNAKFGRDTVTVAAAGTHKRWAALAENKTPCYTTRWEELPRAK